jgi:hypothetical protein
LIQKEQWRQSSADPLCVISNAIVRRLASDGGNLCLSVMGDCEGIDNAVCSFTPLQKKVSPRLNMQAELRHGMQTNTVENSTKVVRLTRTIWVDCGPLDISSTANQGVVDLEWKNNKFLGIPWNREVIGERFDLVICTRIYATPTWRDLHTDRLISWLKWYTETVGADHGRKIRVDMYIADFNFYDKEQEQRIVGVFKKLSESGVLHLYDWTSANTFEMPSHLWQYGQLSYTSECIARNEQLARYVLPVDIDEFLFLPQEALTAQDAIGALDTIGGKTCVLIYIHTVMVFGSHACNDTAATDLVCKKDSNPSDNRQKYAVKSNYSRATVDLLPNIHTAAPLVAGDWCSAPLDLLHLNHHVAHANDGSMSSTIVDSVIVTRAPVVEKAPLVLMVVVAFTAVVLVVALASTVVASGTARVIETSV